MVRQTMTTRRIPADRPAGAATDNGQRTTDNGPRGGFTLVELLVVIIVLAMLMALLLPAINGAMRSARNSAVSAEINQMASALADFKAKYGDYPPSRFLAVENGNYSTFLGDSTSLSGGTMTDPSSPGVGDITLGQLAQRSVSVLRKFWPRVLTTGLPSTSVWYDFNGDGVLATTPYILHGHECLVLFLGGVPLADGQGNYGLTGFGKDPTNPFTNMIVGNTMYNANRQPSFFQFNPGRLYLDPNNQSGIPGYYDTLSGTAPTGLSPINFYVYFSAYGNGNYDPNDVNFPNEADSAGNAPIGLNFLVNFPTSTSKTHVSGAVSPSPNPYSTTTTVPASGTVTYQNPQTFQIISAGGDGLYGVGGQFLQSSQSGTLPLPFDPKNTYYGTSLTTETDANVRHNEVDNLTNFKSGTLQ